MSDKDNIAEDIDALLNRTFALEVLVMIMMRDLLSSDAVDRLLQSLREQAVYPRIPVSNVQYLHKPSAALSLALEQIHEDISIALNR